MTGLVLLAAMLADWRWGEPDLLWRRIGHPVVWIGSLIARLDARLNRPDQAGNTARGVLALAVLLVASLGVGAGLSVIADALGVVGLILEAFVVFVMLGQRSLRDHVSAVADGLRRGGLEGGRAAVAMIVGRDPRTLDRAGVARAAVESLAENFSDGVVAPAFWYAVLGLPGILALKAVNTADSMIGHKTARYLTFGRASAQLDDVLMWLPARLSAFLIAGGAALAGPARRGAQALAVAWRDARLARSPNAGWPEAAMAGACGFALGGPRIYPREQVNQAWLNGAGAVRLDGADIGRALAVFDRACLCGGALAVAALTRF